ncbi:MAG: hypothetical protein WAN71_00650 [Mycobacterium sp.]|uniref:hypothetical protein n=1 Tax=Mycobacterium sp. TaxID=1785 RepID=UPI003BAF4457
MNTIHIPKTKLITSALAAAAAVPTILLLGAGIAHADPDSDPAVQQAIKAEQDKWGAYGYWDGVRVNGQNKVNDDNQHITDLTNDRKNAKFRHDRVAQDPGWASLTGCDADCEQKKMDEDDKGLQDWNNKLRTDNTDLGVYVKLEQEAKKEWDQSVQAVTDARAAANRKTLPPQERGGNIVRVPGLAPCQGDPSKCTGQLQQGSGQGQQGSGQGQQGSGQGQQGSGQGKQGTGPGQQGSGQGQQGTGQGQQGTGPGLEDCPGCQGGPAR